jgi:hypothetical protein
MARMTNKELLEYNKDRNICQICIATNRDIEKVLDEWVDKLKVGPWNVLTLSNETLGHAYMGGKEITEPFKCYCALAMYGNIQIEIVQPVYGDCFVDGFLERAGEGLQHFKEKIPDSDMDEKIKELEAAGFPKTFWGGLKEDRFCNFDSEGSLGFSLEIGNFADITLTDDMYYVYPRE